jgi:hypothetical protein
LQDDGRDIERLVGGEEGGGADPEEEAGEGREGWPGGAPGRGRWGLVSYSPLNFWTFISRYIILYHFISLLYQFYHPQNKFLYHQLVWGPAKNFGAPPFFSTKALQNEARNIKI